MKILSRRTELIVIFTGFALSEVLLFNFVPINFVPKNLVQNDSVLLQKRASLPPPTSYGLPVRLKIPKINLDSAVENVGLTNDGEMDIPKDISNVGWFNLGPRPGENGSAVIDGHYGTKNDKESAFDNLYKLRQGDKIYVEDDKGAVIAFVVTGNQRYDPKADASGVFGSNDGKSHLNLVTCEGEWNKITQSYLIRLVVFTDKE